MSTKKSAVKNPKAPKPEEPQPQGTPTEARPEPKAVEPRLEPEAPAAPTVAPTPALTLKYLHQELESLKQVVGEHATLITQLQETLARKRKSVASNGKVQIRDKQTGTVYPSKNNAYQTLLKSGELKELMEKGVFGEIPQKNTFGWYVLVREWPDRFEEVPTEEKQA